jgi:hypothetical protein
MNMRDIWNVNDSGKQKYWKEINTSATPSTTNTAQNTGKKSIPVPLRPPQIPHKVLEKMNTSATSSTKNPAQSIGKNQYQCRFVHHKSRTKYWKNQYQCHFVHHKYRTKYWEKSIPVPLRPPQIPHKVLEKINTSATSSTTNPAQSIGKN